MYLKIISIFISVFLCACSSQSTMDCSISPPSLMNLKNNERLYFSFERRLSDGTIIKSDFIVSKNAVEFITFEEIYLNQTEIDNLDYYFLCAVEGGALFHHTTSFDFKLYDRNQRLCDWQYDDVRGCVEIVIVRASLMKTDFVSSPNVALWRRSDRYSTISSEKTHLLP